MKRMMLEHARSKEADPKKRYNHNQRWKLPRNKITHKWTGNKRKNWTSNEHGRGKGERGGNKPLHNKGYTRWYGKSEKYIKNTGAYRQGRNRQRMAGQSGKIGKQATYGQERYGNSLHMANQIVEGKQEQVMMMTKNQFEELK